MQHAEFEFWKIDSAFEPTSISALLPEKFISELLDALVKKAVRVSYDTKKLEAAFTNFGWGMFLPLEKRDIFSAKQLYEHCHLRLVDALGEDAVRKKYDDAFSAEKFVAAVYFAYKATEMLDHKFIRGGVRVSSAGNCRMGLKELTQYLFITRGVPKDRLYTSVLSVAVYSVASDFRKGLERTQQEALGYSIGRGAAFGKVLSEDLVRFLELSAQCATAARKGGGGQDNYQLFYRTGESQSKDLQAALGGLGITFQLRRGGNLSIDTTTPFRIMANYFGLQWRLDRESLALMAHAAAKRMDEGTSAPDISHLEADPLLVPMDKEAEELRPREKKASFWKFGRAWKRDERGQMPQQEKPKEKKPKPKKQEAPKYPRSTIGKREKERTGGLFGLFGVWEKEPPVPEYDLSGVKFTKESVRAWVIKLYSEGADLSYENMKRKYPQLYEGIRSNFLVLNGMRLDSKVFLERTVEGILNSFFRRDEKALFDDCINSEVGMRALCRLAKQNNDLKLKRLCGAIFQETANEEVKEVYMRFFKR